MATGAGVFASAKDDHTVYKIKELKVELLPNNGSATTQQGRLFFAIKITATAKYAHLAGIPPKFVIDDTRTTSVVIAIANYWQ